MAEAASLPPLEAELSPEEVAVPVPVQVATSPVAKRKNNKSKRKVKKKKTDFTPFQSTGPLSLDDVKCTVCLSIMIEPVTFPCNHTVCKECFMTYVRDTSLNCPLCRLRLGVWLRKAGKEHTLINTELWERIQQQFPNEVQARLDGEDSQNEFESSINHYRIDGELAQPGAVREEYESLFAKFNAEKERTRQIEEEASNRIIRQEQEEEAQLEAEFEAQLRADAELARRLQEEENKRIREEEAIAKEFQEVLRRNRQAELSKGKSSSSSQSHHKSSNPSLAKRKFNSPSASARHSITPDSKRHCSQAGYSQTRLSVNEGVVSVSKFVRTSPSNQSQQNLGKSCNPSSGDSPKTITDEHNYSFCQISKTPSKSNQNERQESAVQSSTATLQNVSDNFVNFEDLEFTLVNCTATPPRTKTNAECVSRLNKSDSLYDKFDDKIDAVDDFQPYWDNLTNFTLEQKYPGLVIVEKPRTGLIRYPSDSSIADSTNSSIIFDDEAFILRQVEKHKKNAEQEEIDRKLAMKLQREWNSKVYVERDYQTRNRETRARSQSQNQKQSPLQKAQPKKASKTKTKKTVRQSGQTKKQKSSPIGESKSRRTLDSFLIQPLKEIQTELVPDPDPGPGLLQTSPTKSNISDSLRRRSSSGSSVSSSSSSGSSTQPNIGSPLRRPPPNSAAEL